MHVELQFAKIERCAFIFRGAVLRMTLVFRPGPGTWWLRQKVRNGLEF
jgi:hypothetical protein